LKTIDSLLPAECIRASKAPGAGAVLGLTQSTEGALPGSLFFALKGSRSDGHAFVTRALQAGAAAAVVETREAFLANDRTIWVDSTRRALGETASRWYAEPTRALKLVGITGTNGKTTTAFLLSKLWADSGLRTGLIGTVEYRIASEVLPAPLTTPDALTLQSLFHRMQRGGVTHAAMEVSSIALDQSRVAGSHFDVALFTNLTPDHLDYHGTMDAYFDAKLKLFTELAPRVSIFNVDDPAGQRLRQAARSDICWTYSAVPGGADFHAVAKEMGPRGLRATIQTPVGRVILRSPLLGLHNLSNCLGVIAAQVALGEDLELTAELLAGNPGAPGRLERVAEGLDRPHIFVDYAHTEDALKNVLESLRKVRAEGPGRIITVFGCGGDRDRGKRPRMAAVAASLSDLVVATSDNPRTEDPEAILDEMAPGIPSGVKYHRDADRRAAIHWALEQAAPGDFVLVAGKGHETYQILGAEKPPFDDRKVIREYYGL
jgi:UDP-N-acetylmuramoyl-L-alanyl-D-glutamate--2,6-diaminopimelate ligase